MDQGPLVTEQIVAGEPLVAEFDKYASLQAAYWLKEREEGIWYLYLASDRIDDANTGEAYAEVIRILRKRKEPNLWLDSFQVKVVGVDDPTAKDVIDRQQRYPASIPARIQGERVGDFMIDDGYIYALPKPKKKRAVRK